MRKIIGYLMAGASAVVLFPALCFGQVGTVVGIVTDSSGALIPGVSVEAASPALIEKARTAVSDESGRYRIEQLSPGAYTVTFSLPGFSTFRREDIAISSGFTATINASLKVGTVATTITVTGQAPVVDVRNTLQQRTLLSEELDALPTSKSFATIGNTLPGLTQSQRDVGGTTGETGNMLSAHGGRNFDMTIQIAGSPIGTAGFGGGAWTTFSLNDAAVQEVEFQTGNISSDSSSGGVKINVIPRQGGNSFHGTVFVDGAKRSLSRSNYTDRLKVQGLAAPTGFTKLWDESVGVGGPILRDRLWFYYAQRYRGDNRVTGSGFFSIDPNSIAYNPDLKRPVTTGGYDLDNQVRLTAQLNPRNKVTGFFDMVEKCNCPFGGTIGESALQLTYPPVWLTSINWTATLSPRVVLEASASRNRQSASFSPLNLKNISTTAPISVLEQTTNRRMRAPFTGGNVDHQFQNNLSGTLSYLTGAHAAKVGFNLHNSHRSVLNTVFSNSMAYTVSNGTPIQVSLTTAPYTSLSDNLDLGVFVEDKWTVAHRLTMSGSVRFDYYNGSIPEQSAPAGRWIGARKFDAVKNIPNWKDISPRIGASYDVFGNGKTAIKAAVSRYVDNAQVYGFTTATNPFATTVNAATRGWTDGLNGNPLDFTPQGDPLNPAANGEFTGTLSNLNFGKSVVTLRNDPNLSSGWGKRGYNWEYSVSVQHELVTRVSLEVSYAHRMFGNQTVTDNLDLTPADYDTFCITAPADSRLGSASGSRICGLYDIKPTKTGIASNRVTTFAKNFPDADINGRKVGTFSKADSVDVTVNVRPNSKFFLLAGVSTGRSHNASCSTVDNPSNRFCETRSPFQGNYRVSGAYTFPWQLQLSGVYQSLPPNSIGANFAATNAVTQASLGRPLSGQSVTVALLEPFTLVGDRVNQVDLRLTKKIQFEQLKLEIMVDGFNVFNTAPVLTQTTTFGSAWLVPTSILQSAFLKLGARFTF